MQVYKVPEVVMGCLPLRDFIMGLRLDGVHLRGLAILELVEETGTYRNLGT